MHVSIQVHEKYKVPLKSLRCYRTVRLRKRTFNRRGGRSCTCSTQKVLRCTFTVTVQKIDEEGWQLGDRLEAETLCWIGAACIRVTNRELFKRAIFPKSMYWTMAMLCETTTHHHGCNLHQTSINTNADQHHSDKKGKKTLLGSNPLRINLRGDRACETS